MCVCVCVCAHYLPTHIHGPPLSPSHAMTTRTAKTIKDKPAWPSVAGPGHGPHLLPVSFLISPWHPISRSAISRWPAPWRSPSPDGRRPLDAEEASVSDSVAVAQWSTMGTLAKPTAVPLSHKERCDVYATPPPHRVAICRLPDDWGLRTVRYDMTLGGFIRRGRYDGCQDGASLYILIQIYRPCLMGQQMKGAEVP